MQAPARSATCTFIEKISFYPGTKYLIVQMVHLPTKMHRAPLNSSGSFRSRTMLSSYWFQKALAPLLSHLDTTNEWGSTVAQRVVAQRVVVQPVVGQWMV